MTGKLNVVLTVLLVGSALSVVNARYQRNHLVNDLEKLNGALLRGLKLLTQVSVPP